MKQDSCSAEGQSVGGKPGLPPWLSHQPVSAARLLQLLNEGIGLDHLQDSFLKIKNLLSTEKVVTKLPRLTTWPSCVGLPGSHAH